MKEVLLAYFEKHEEDFRKVGIGILAFFGAAFILYTFMN